MKWHTKVLEKRGVYNENMHGDEYVAEIDGSAQPNPGPGGWGVYLEGPGIKKEACGPISHTTNNLAEYCALAEAVRLARSLGARRLTVRTDSELVYNQYNGKRKARNPKIAEALNRIKKEEQEAGIQVEVVLIPREKNARAHALSRKGLDLALSERGPDSGCTKE